MFKNKVRGWIYSSARNPAFYRRFWHPLARLAALAYREHARTNLPILGDPKAIIQQICPEGKVAHGPFAGMIYPVAEAAGSSIWPKLLGSYEQELREFFEQAPARNYQNIVDIGCAEGYYAVGLARQCLTAKVFAYDTDQRAKDLCLKMAKANGVSDRLNLGGFCDRETLSRLGQERSLVISDCEGYEAELFTPDTIASLKNADLVIEIHDFLRPGTSRQLYPRLVHTHQVQRLRSIPDMARPQVFRYEELANIDDATRIELMAEMRPMPMEWFVCTSRS